jgi:predicted nucleotidyltransferase component of viral defense system
LLGTKVRALYQRRKGRDLFDLWLGLTEGKARASEVVRIFKEYLKANGQEIKRDEYEKNIQEKIKHSGFKSDLIPLCPAYLKYDLKQGFDLIRREILLKL